MKAARHGAGKSAAPKNLEVLARIPSLVDKVDAIYREPTDNNRHQRRQEARDFCR